MITGREIKEEYLDPAFDLLGCARARRLKWAGQLLRAEESFLPRRTALAELERTEGLGQPGGIFQDAPKGFTVQELVMLACDMTFWNARSRCLKTGVDPATVFVGREGPVDRRKPRQEKSLTNEAWLESGYTLVDGVWNLDW